MSEIVKGQDLVPFTVATWVFSLHVAGATSSDQAINDACENVIAATNETAGNAAGDLLVARISELLGSNADVTAACTALYPDAIRTDMGDGDRLDRTARIRKYQFTRQLPWLARIWERTDEGVQPTWLLVERVTDEVTAADPNPWNDVDEERHLPVADFHVLWDLDQCTSVALA